MKTKKFILSRNRVSVRIYGESILHTPGFTQWKLAEILSHTEVEFYGKVISTTPI
jgi:uncharacterized protein CbrC (UPF0167 family)